MIWSWLIRLGHHMDFLAWKHLRCIFLRETQHTPKVAYPRQPRNHPQMKGIPNHKLQGSVGKFLEYLGGGFKYLLFLHLPGEDEPILTSIFFRWVETQPPTRYLYLYLQYTSKNSLFFLRRFRSVKKVLPGQHHQLERHQWCYGGQPFFWWN